MCLESCLSSDPKSAEKARNPELSLVGIEKPIPFAISKAEGGNDRRGDSERRESPTRIWDSILGFSRRARGRRDGEIENIYVDSYTREDLLLTVGVLVLNILDAFLTLRWMSMGGGEGNPLMDMLIRSNDILFLFQKCVVVGVWLVILVIHKNFRIARLGLWGAFILYSGILLYHFALQAGEPPRPAPSEARGLSHSERVVVPDSAPMGLQAAAISSRMPSSSARSSI